MLWVLISAILEHVCVEVGLLLASTACACVPSLSYPSGQVGSGAMGTGLPRGGCVSAVFAQGRVWREACWKGREKFLFERVVRHWDGEVVGSRPWRCSRAAEMWH